MSESHCSLGCQLRNELESPRKGKDCQAGTLLAADQDFQKSIKEYLHGFCQDTKQLAHGRPQVLTAAQKVVPKVNPDQLWCGFAQVSESYFEALSEQFHWSKQEKTELHKHWLELTILAFVPSSESRRIDIKDMKAWIERFQKSTGTGSQ